MGATESVARWIVDTSYKEIPPDAIRVAKESCFDCLGVILAGSVQPVGQIIQKYVQEQGGIREATVLSLGLKTTLANAALANGTMGHALDYDDFGGFGHPTVVIFPPLLALGEKLGASGRDVLEAFVIGFEVALAIYSTTHYSQIKRGFHSTPTFGRLAGAAACAKLMKLDQRQTATALAIAGSMASGLIHNFGTMTKPLYAGLASRDGVMAAGLASMGMTAGDKILEHPLGFVRTFCGEGIWDLNKMAANLGRPFKTQDALMIKKYPCCGANHSLLDSLLGLMREHKFTYRDIEKVEVEQLPTSAVMLYTHPRDELQAKFSALYNAAAALVDGDVRIETFTLERIEDPILGETMSKVRLDVKSQWVEGWDAHQVGTPVHVHLKDGRVLSRSTPRSGILGSQQNPWGFDNIKKKFQVGARLALPEAEVKDAVEVWSRMEEIKDVRQAIKTVVRDDLNGSVEAAGPKSQFI